MAQTGQPFVVNEEGTLRITALVTDELGVAIPGSSLTTMTYTLYDLASDAIINLRSAVDIKANVDASGNLVLVLLPADNPIVAPTKVARGARERHIVLFKWTYATGRGHWTEVQVDVVNLNRVPVVA
jgi:hypothetical protein